MTTCRVCKRDAVVIVSVRFTTLEEPRCDDHAQYDHPKVRVERRLMAQN